MDHSVIEDQDIVVRYVQGTLQADEAERFEEHYFECAECLEALELTRRLDDGLKDLAADERARVAQTAVLAWLARRGRAFQVGLSLAFLALLVSPWLLLAPEVSRLSSDLDQATAPQVETPTGRLSAERSGGDATVGTRIELGETPRWIHLRLDIPPLPNASRYRVRVSSESALVWESGPVDGRPGGTLDLRLHTSWLEAGTYRIDLETVPDGVAGPDSSERAGVYTVEMIAF